MRRRKTKVSEKGAEGKGVNRFPHGRNPSLKPLVSMGPARVAVGEVLKTHSRNAERAKALTRLMSRAGAGREVNPQVMRFLENERLKVLGTRERKQRLSHEQLYVKNLLKGIEKDIWRHFDAGNYSSVAGIFKHLVDVAGRNRCQEQVADFFVEVAQEIKRDVLESQGREKAAARRLFIDALTKAIKLYEQSGKPEAAASMAIIKNLAKEAFKAEQGEY